MAGEALLAWRGEVSAARSHTTVTPMEGKAPIAGHGVEQAAPCGAAPGESWIPRNWCPAGEDIRWDEEGDVALGEGRRRVGLAIGWVFFASGLGA